MTEASTDLTLDNPWQVGPPVASSPFLVFPPQVWNATPQRAITPLVLLFPSQFSPVCHRPLPLDWDSSVLCPLANSDQLSLNVISPSPSSALSI